MARTVECRRCMGTGYILIVVPPPEHTRNVPCPVCGGSGQVPNPDGVGVRYAGMLRYPLAGL